MDIFELTLNQTVWAMDNNRPCRGVVVKTTDTSELDKQNSDIKKTRTVVIDLSPDGTQGWIASQREVSSRVFLTKEELIDSLH